MRSCKMMSLVCLLMLVMTGNASTPAGTYGSSISFAVLSSTEVQGSSSGTRSTSPLPGQIIRLLPYGLAAGDSRYTGPSSVPFRIQIDLGIMIFGKSYNQLAVSLNGLVTPDDAPYSGYPVPSNAGSTLLQEARGLLIAPFLSMQSVSNFSDSGLYTHLYCSDQNDAESVLLEVAQWLNMTLESSSDTMRLQCVLVITWRNLARDTLYPDSSTSKQVNTYQVVLASDGISSYAFITYDDMGWSLRSSQPVCMGYASGRSEYFSHCLSDYALYDLNAQPGNIKKLGFPNGRWFFKFGTAKDLLEVPTYVHDCVRWYNEDVYGFPGLPDLQKASQCPTNKRVAQYDSRIVFSKESVSTWLFGSGSASWQCCFSDDKSPFAGALISPADSHECGIQRYNSLNNETSDLHEQYDVRPAQWCCGNNDRRMCSMYYKRRPQSSIGAYKQPRKAWSGGDPHFLTLDSFEYTFNGRGDYWLVKTNDSSFSLQARTDIVWVTNSVTTSATQFVALAAADGGSDSAHLYVALVNDRTAMQVYVNGKDTYFMNSSISSLSFKNLYLSKTSSYGNETEFLATFASGFALQCGFSSTRNLIDFGVTAPESYKRSLSGLLGNFNDDKNDDLVPRLGRPLPNDSSDADIYEFFGKSWAVQPNESLMIESQTQLNYTFTPSFFNSTAMDTINISLACDNSRQCMYDAWATGNLNFGLGTKQQLSQAQAVAAVLANQPPSVAANPTVLNATVGEPLNATISFTDSKDQTLTLLYDQSKLPSGLDLLNSTNGGLTLYISWTPKRTELTNGSLQLSWAAEDNYGATSSVLTLPVHYCLGCSKPNGSCNFDLFMDGSTYNTQDAFKEVACKCQPGFGGKNCESVLDVCIYNPCAPGLCTPSLGGNRTLPFICSNCGDGYILKDGICRDLDECMINETACDLLYGYCRNTPGSFQCTCTDSTLSYNNRTRKCEVPTTTSVIKVNMIVQVPPLVNGTEYFAVQLQDSLRAILRILPDYVYVFVYRNISNVSLSDRSLEFVVGLNRITSEQAVLTRLATAFRDNDRYLLGTPYLVLSVTGSSPNHTCQNGNVCQFGGTCENYLDIATCRCNFAWSSDDCSQFTTDGLIASIVGAVALAVLIVIIAGAAVLYARRRTARRYRNRYYTSESSSGSLEYPSGKRPHAYHRKESQSWQRFANEPAADDEAEDVDSIFGARSNVTVHRVPRNDPDTLSFDFPTFERDINSVRADMTLVNQIRPFAGRQSYAANN